jgi:hypothetical protein
MRLSLEATLDVLNMSSYLNKRNIPQVKSPLYENDLQAQKSIDTFYSSKAGETTEEVDGKEIKFVTYELRSTDLHFIKNHFAPVENTTQLLLEARVETLKTQFGEDNVKYASDLESNDSATIYLKF